jgi:peptide/nickel transport system substrate-binding protein
MVAKLVTLLGIIMVLAVACGGAPAAPDPNTAPTAEPTAAPGVSESSQPTSTPQAVASPAEVEVHPGKVTWMAGNLGNERFDPTFATGGEYLMLMHATLISSVVEDGMMVLTPGIASKWEVSDDGLTWTLTIRKGVKFHDGTEVTTEDVLWSRQHYFGPQAKEYGTSVTVTSWSNIMDRIEQTGPDQVSVTTTVPQASFPEAISDITGASTGAVFPKRATLHNLEEEAAYDRNPIGAGILRLVNHVPAEIMAFERFADHYYQPQNGFPTDKRPKFTTFDLRLVPEESTRVAALRAGEADIAPISLASRQQVEAGGGRVVFGNEGVYLIGRQYGCKTPEVPCYDQRVRQALAYSVDKEVMRDRLFGPEVLQIKGWGFVTPSSIGYSPELDPFPYDPDKARQLLADAGYPGGEGFGKLVVNTWTSSASPFLPEAAQLIAEFWRRDLGLDVEVRVGDEAALRKAFTQSEDLYGQILFRDDETKRDMQSSLRNQYAPPSAYQRVHNDPELFALTEKTLAVFDPVEQEKIYNSTARRLRDEAFDIGFGYLNLPWGVGPRIVTWEPNPMAPHPSGLETITLK